MSSLYYQKLAMQLEDTLDALPAQQNHPLLLLQEKIRLIRKTLRELETFTLQHPFADQAAEIDFFKEVKPRFWSNLIYEIECYNLLINQPVGTKDMISHYLEEELRQIDRFYRRHAFHYHYYQLRATEMDRVYFLRAAEVHNPAIPEWPLMDNQFSTALDGLFAKFMAYERLQHHILKQLENLTLAAPGAMTLAESIKWTGESINLAEIAYGLWLTGQLNHGNAGIGEIVRWLEEQLHVKVGRPHRRWTEISGRTHNSYTKFTDRMRDAIRLRVNEELEAGALKRKARRTKE